MIVYRVLYLLCSGCLLAGCLDTAKPPQPSALIVLDTDMGSDCDDVGALALLHQYVREGDAEILAVIYSSSAVPYGVGIIDAINTYYGHPDLPIGADHTLTFGDPVDKMLAEKLAKDTAAFGHDRVHNLDVAEQTLLNRQILAGQEDGSVTYVTIGHTKGLHDLLMSKGDSITPMSGKELLERKLKKWVALGALRADEVGDGFSQDWNFFRNNTARYTAHLVKELDVESYFISAGADVMTGASLVHTPSGNIVRTAYRDWLWNVFQATLEHQRPSWDLAAVYFAVKGHGDYLENGDSGYLSFDSLQGSRWVPGGNSRPHFFIKQKRNVSAAFADYLNGKIAIEP